MAPDEEARKSLNITHEQVERSAREEGLLRAVGAGFLIKQYYDDSFFLKFIASIYKPVAKYMYSESTGTTNPTLCNSCKTCHCRIQSIIFKIVSS